MIDVPVSLPELQSSADVVYFVESDAVIFQLLVVPDGSRRRWSEGARQKKKSSPAPNERLDLQIVANLCNSPWFFF